jgi:nitronate monooxygenase
MKSRLFNDLRVPVVVAPMFLVSGPGLVKASCLAGVIGSFPFPNARDISTLDSWLDDISSELGKVPSAAPYAVNITTHRSYDRLKDELDLIKNHKPRIVITALGGPEPVIETVQSYGGSVVADVNSLPHARKAVGQGVDGLALISAGAGGHTGHIAGLSFVSEVREFFDGLVILAGGIGTGGAVRAAEVAGADLCYMGTRFIASAESIASEEYKRTIVEACYEDLILTDKVTGAKAYYLRQSLEKMGLDVQSMHKSTGINLSNSESQIRAWKDVWSAGHGVGSVKTIEPLAAIISQLHYEYDLAS